MRRYVVLAFGILAYLVGLTGLLAFVSFVAGAEVLGNRLDGQTPWSAPAAVLFDCGLVALFGIQHTVMARVWFKRAVARVVPPAVERGAFVLASGVLLLLLCRLWQPVGGTVWRLEGELAWTAITLLQVAGWAFAVAATLQASHFELFGLVQAHAYFQGRTHVSRGFTDRRFYGIVRHPQQLGMLVGLWSAPSMSCSHLVLSAGMTLYTLVGLRCEERELVATFGSAYRDYKKRVNMLVPLPRRALVRARAGVSGGARRP